MEIKDKAVEMAAQVWCRPECGDIVMDPTLAYAFADVLAKELQRIVGLMDFVRFVNGGPGEYLGSNAPEYQLKFIQEIRARAQVLIDNNK